MKKTELKNCPQWLLDADTENEDVFFDEYGILQWVSGDFRGGDFLGGNFWSGDFLGGNFWSGDFRGGDFRGGNFRGGDFRGGNFLGGDFRGGNFWSGDFLGGNFLGGNFWSGDFRGEKLAQSPVTVCGIGSWSATVTPTMLHIGCQRHTHAEWRSFTDDQISGMATGAAEFWTKNRDLLLAICDREAAIG